MSSWLRRVSLCTFMILLYASVSAAADFPSAKRAYEEKDYAAALNEFTPLAQQGNADAADKYGACAKQTSHSFNQRFWFAAGGYLFDVVDCNGERGTTDSSCRPNQLFAISLDHPVLDQAWRVFLLVGE